MVADALLAWQSPAVTKTAAFDSAAITSMQTGTSKIIDTVAHVIYSAASTSAGAGSAVFGIKVSEDGGTTWNVIAQLEPIALSTTPAASEAYLPFQHNPGHYPTNTPQYRFSLVNISGTGATITYQAFYEIAATAP